MHSTVILIIRINILSKAVSVVIGSKSRFSIVNERYKLRLCILFGRVLVTNRPAQHGGEKEIIDYLLVVVQM